VSARILVIDDEASIRDTLRMILEYEGYRCLVAATGEEGLATARSESPDLVFLDIKMPGMDGLDVLAQLKAQDEALPVVMISGHGTVATAVEATEEAILNAMLAAAPRPGRLGRTRRSLAEFADLIADAP
jgi:DNA-binding NtrC family response regulator